MNDLSHIHKEIARLEFAGLKPGEITEALSDLQISREYVDRIRSNPIYQHFLKRMEDSANKEVRDIRKTLITRAHDMLDVVLEIAEDDRNTPGTRLAAARDILDRAGYKPIAKEVRLNINEGFTPDERRSLRELHDQMRFGGFVLDVDFQEVAQDRSDKTLPAGTNVEQEEISLIEELQIKCDCLIVEETNNQGEEN